MNKIMTSLTLLAGLGLATLAPQAHAGDRHHERDDYSYSQYYGHDGQRAYRRGYHDARRDIRKHHRAKRHQRYYRHHDRYRRHGYHGYSGHDRHGRANYRHNSDWRVIFKF